MKIKNYFKVFILLIIFYKCNCNQTSVFNKSICKRLTNKNCFAIEERYYCSKHKKSNKYYVYTKDILRKYVYVVNIIIVYLILQSF